MVIVCIVEVWGVMLGAVCFGCGVEKQLGEWSIGY